MKKKRIALILLILVVVAATASCDKGYEDGDGDGNASQLVIEEGADDGQESLTTSYEDQIEDQYTWDLTKLYQDDQAVAQDVEQLKEAITVIVDLEDAFTETYDGFESVLLTYDQANRTLEKLYVYANLNLDLNTLDDDALNLVDEVSGLEVDLNVASAYIFPAIYQMDNGTIEGYVSEPNLSSFKDDILALINSEEPFSEDAQAVIAMTGDMTTMPNEFYETFVYMTDFEDFMPKIDYNALYSEEWNEVERELEKLYTKEISGINILALALKSQVEVTKFSAYTNGYDTALEMKLDEDGLSEEQYNLIFDKVDQNLSAQHKWVDFIGDVWGLDRVHEIDLNFYFLPTDDEFIDYEEAKTIVLTALEPMGEDYLNLMRMGLDSRWVDVYPTENKYEGGYQWGVYGYDPYVLLNYDGTLDSVSTLAHEMGHAINFYKSNEAQPYETSEVQIFNAEIASTTNEIILREYMLSHAKDDEERLKALYDYIYLIQSTFFEQLKLAEFEKTIYEASYEGENLDADYMKETYAQICDKYFGERFANDSVNVIFWSDIPHFYDPYYVYKYSTGISVGMMFAQEIINGDAEDVERYMTFLESGSEDTPVAILEATGINMKDMEPIDLIMKRYEELVDEFIELYNETY